MADNKRKQEEENEAPSAKKQQLSFIPVYIDQTRHEVEFEKSDTLGSLIKSHPQIFDKLLPGDFIDSNKLKFIHSTTHLANWNENSLTADTLVVNLKQLVPVYFLILHHWYLKVPRMMTVGVLKHKLKRFLKGMNYDKGQILYHEDSESLPNVPDTTTPIKDYGFNLVNSPSKKILQIWIKTAEEKPLPKIIKKHVNHADDTNPQKIIEIWDGKIPQSEAEKMISYLETSTCRLNDLDFTKMPITNYPFKLKNSSTGKVLELWDDLATLEKAGIEDNCVVFFEGDRTTATSPNFRLYLNEYQKIVFPRESSWSEFESIVAPFIRPLISAEEIKGNYVVVKRALEACWNPIVKQLDYSIDLKFQLQSRDLIFATNQHVLPEGACGEHLLYLKTNIPTTSDKTLVVLKVNPELPILELMQHLKCLNVKEIEEAHPCDLCWDNYDKYSDMINTREFKCKEIPAKTILKFPSATKKSITIKVYTPELNFQDFELLSTDTFSDIGKMKWEDFELKYIDVLKTKYNFIPPPTSELVYRYSDRKQNSWSNKEKKGKTLSWYSMRNRSSTVYFSLKVPIRVTESVDPALTIFYGMHHSIHQAIRIGSRNRYPIHRLCVETSETGKYEPVDKHLPVLLFVGKQMRPFSYLIVNGEKLLCPHFLSVQQLINSNSFTIVNNKGVAIEWTTENAYHLIYPERWLPSPNDELTNAYDKASLWGHTQHKFKLDRISLTDFNLSLVTHFPHSLPFNPHFRISMRSIYSKKPPKIFSLDTVNNIQRRWYDNALSSSTWDRSNNNDFTKLGEIIRKGCWNNHKEKLEKAEAINKAKVFKYQCKSFIDITQKRLESKPNKCEDVMIQRALIFQSLKEEFKKLPIWSQIHAKKHLKKVKTFLMLKEAECKLIQQI
jgi:hypothetical protein